LDIINEVVRRYFGGNTFATLVHEQLQRHGQAYRSDMAGPRDWLSKFDLDLWPLEEPVFYCASREHPCQEKEADHAAIR
jgi:hypothetical protein